MDRYLLESAFSENTRASYGRVLRSVGKWLDAEHLDPAELRPWDVLCFLDIHEWSSATRYHCWQALKGFLRWRYGEHHPALKLKVRRPVSSPQKTLSTNELLRLFASIDSRTTLGRRDRALLMLMLDNGLRASEVCRLELQYLDLEKRLLDVLAKGARWRRAVFSCATGDAIARWLTVRKAIAGTGVMTVFVSVGGIRPGTPLTRAGLRSIFRSLGRKSDIPRLSPHVMRRTFATLAIARGASTRLVQAAAGWSSVRMVERYTQALQPEDFDGYFPTEIVSRG